MNLFIFISEMQPTLFKGSANRRQYKASLLVFIVEMQPTLLKGSANRRQYKTSLLVFIVEMPLTLLKGSSNRRQYKASLLVFIVEMQPTLFKGSANREEYTIATNGQQSSEFIHFYFRDAASRTAGILSDTVRVLSHDFQDGSLWAMSKGHYRKACDRPAFSGHCRV